MPDAATNPDPIQNGPAANLVPQIPPIPAIPPIPTQPLKLLPHLRKYDGTTNSLEYITRLTTDLDLYKIPYSWMLANFDRVFEKQALAWYNSIYPQYAIYTAPDIYEDWVLERFQREFLAFFNDEGLLQTYKQQNRAIRFSPQDDPQEYVTKKLQALRNINPDMSEKKKVDNLLKGLPNFLQLTFVGSTLDSTTTFLSQLRKYSEIQNRKKDSAPSSKIYNYPAPSSYNPTEYLAAAQVQRVPPTNPKPSNVTICEYCHYPGHNKRYCRNRWRDEDRQIFRNERPYYPDLEEHKRKLAMQFNNERPAPPQNQQYSQPRFPVNNANAQFRNNNYQPRYNNFAPRYNNQSYNNPNPRNYSPRYIQPNARYNNSNRNEQAPQINSMEVHPPNANPSQIPNSSENSQA